MKKMIATLLIVIIMISLAGCDSHRVTIEKYDKITTGMTLDEVNEIMGFKGTMVGQEITFLGMIEAYVYQEKDKTWNVDRDDNEGIAIMLFNNKISAKGMNIDGVKKEYSVLGGENQHD